MTIPPMIALQLQLFLLILIGVYARKRQIITEQGRKTLSDLLIGVILPCNIVASFELELTEELLASAGKVLIISFAAQAFYVLCSHVLFRRIPRAQQMVLRYATICSNAGFLGLPIVGSLYGAEGTLYVSIALIPLRVFMWSSGLSLFTNTTASSTVRVLLTHPCILAVFVGFAVLFLPWELPGFLSATIHAVGNCTVAVSMLIIGGILAEISPRTVFSKSALYYSFLRLVAIPAVVFVVLRLLRMDPLLTAVSVLLAAMPAGSTTAILAAKYGGDAEYASKIIFVSTALSLVTIPLFTVLL